MTATFVHLFNAEAHNIFPPKHYGDSQTLSSYGTPELITELGLAVSEALPFVGWAGRFFKSFCFTAGTLVHTKKGLKPIENVEVGDQVASRDEVTGKTTWKPVVRLFSNTNKLILKVTLENEEGQQETLGTTPEHPFYVVNKGWTEAGQLKAGDSIVSLEVGQVQRIHSVIQASERQDTYNFEVADFHSYFVGQFGAWVHNTCPIPWSSKSVRDAAKALDNGATDITVANRSEAEELLLGKYTDYHNTTSLSPTQTKEIYGTKAGNYHWDVGSKSYPHGQDHLQIHDVNGDVIRIYFN